MSTNNGSFDQATHTLTIIGQQEPTDDHLRVLHDGYLADLMLGIKEGTLPPRDDFRKLIGLPPVELITEIDFGMSLDAMIAAGNYDGKNGAITADKFPVEGTGKKKFRNKLFPFDPDISSEDAVAAMEKEKFTPATHVHGLAFKATFPDMQHKFSIACLGSSAWVRGHRYVVYLFGDAAEERYLDLYDWDNDWDDDWRFLGVQEVSGA
jgi:hypothetical protein